MLMSLPCKVVYEIETDKPTFSGIKTRRCGLSFEQLSRTHSEQLKVMLDLTFRRLKLAIGVIFHELVSPFDWTMPVPSSLRWMEGGRT
jgi:hypothetical protein